MRKNKSKAFTLVELMIVISIIGVLAITLLPKLQGAQARSRDAGRIASITSVEAVLNTYFSDEGQFPRHPSSTNGLTSINDTDGDGCLSTNDGTVHSGIEGLFKGQKAPLDPHKNNTVFGCSVGGSYAYYSLEKDGINDNSYMLSANVESYQKANFKITSISIPKDGTALYNDIKGNTYGVWGKLSSEPTDGANGSALDSVYAIIN